MSKQRKCWITRDAVTIHIHEFRPTWWVYNKTFHRNYSMSDIEDIPPQLAKMWKRALKGKRGKAAICECVWETWVPLTRLVRCMWCVGNGVIYGDGSWPKCNECDGTGKIKRPMEPGDL